MTLARPAPVETAPLQLAEIPKPVPGPGQILVRVKACGVCHTDLHTIEGELELPVLPIIPGHQIVGTVAEHDAEFTAKPALERPDEILRFAQNDGSEGTPRHIGPASVTRDSTDDGERTPGADFGLRVGIPWVNSTCGECRFCRSGRENLCENARFTGLHVNGGYADYTVVDERFAYPLPDGLSDVEAAPLLCAGIIGFRALRCSHVQPGQRLGLFGFGASAHIALQIARYWNCPTFVFTRGEEHRRLALELGAVWAGAAQARPPEKLDSAIIFAPVGDLVKTALAYLDRGGTVAHAGIHSTPIPQLEYPLIYHERSITSVANATREDALALLRLSAEIPIRTEVEAFPLEEANHVLRLLKAGQIRGAAVLKIS
jgi:propanol-preferring alcohol dehydrogenase